MTVDSNTRFTAEEALNHQFISLADNQSSPLQPTQKIKPLFTVREELQKQMEEKKSSDHLLSSKEKMKAKFQKNKFQDFNPKSEKEPKLSGTDSFIKGKDNSNEESKEVQTQNVKNTTFNK